MSFYKQIAPYYHHIFKTNAAQINFVTSKIINRESNIVDVGCGIGTLSFELMNCYNSVIGIDMDSEMIESALRKTDTTSKNIQFRELSMLALNKAIDKNSVDGIICFGNTLVHLKSLEEVAHFLQQAKDILKPNGKLLFQIVNYDRILSKNVKQLPLIDNYEIIFERHYNYRKPENKIDFNTQLTVKSTKQIIKNSIELLPVLKSEIEGLLNISGFTHSNFYGNFKKEPYTIDSPALIVEAF